MTVYVIGGINQDIVATSESHLRPGETLNGDTLNYYPGGKGANQAIAAARAGAGVAMIGCIGNDAAGKGLRSYLVRAGVDVDRVSETDDAPTGTALIVVAQGENAIIVVQGANQHVGVANIQGVPFAKGDIVVAQFETPVDTTLAAFTAARSAGARTMLNPSPVTNIEQALLDQTDVLVVNEHEFEMIFGVPLGPVLTEEAGKPDSFAGVLVITLGVNGVLALSGGTWIRQPGRVVDVVDSTGAGDCFAGYLAAALHEEHHSKAPDVGGDEDGLAMAIGLANRAAGISVTRPGAASSMPNRSEVEGDVS